MASVAPDAFGFEPWPAVPFAMTTFENDGGYDDMIVVRDLAFRSSCVHDGLPVSGVVHVGYHPNARIVGLSKFARLVDHCASRSQTQERFTKDIADVLDGELCPKGVGVVVETDHDCSGAPRAVSDPRTVTKELRGVLRHDPAARREFLHLVLRPRGRRGRR
jgi:GTP cyclohydrolase IA